jgi:electron transfer flavoprotein alpha subunit
MDQEFDVVVAGGRCAGSPDAFRQVESLAPAILGAIDKLPAALDEALARWTRWRDDDAGEH